MAARQWVTVRCGAAFARAAFLRDGQPVLNLSHPRGTRAAPYEGRFLAIQFRARSNLSREARY